MNLRTLIEINIKLLASSRNHSLTECLCRQHLFSDAIPADNARILTEILSKHPQGYSAKIFDWLNILLFNICALNEQLAAACDNRALQSTEDAPVPSKKIKQKQVSPGMVIKYRLRNWLQLVFSSPFFTKLFQQLTPTNINKNKDLRYLLETIDYLLLKYDVKYPMRQHVIQMVEATAKSNTLSFIQDHIKWINKRVFTGGQPLAEFLQLVADNYAIDLQQVAEIVSAAYFNLNPPRKIFDTAQNSGRRVTEEITDFIVRKMNKNDLFSQKMQNYRPFELLMTVILQRQGALLLEFNNIVNTLINNNESSLYQTCNELNIEKIGPFLTITIPQDYPHLHNLLKYLYSSLLVKYSEEDAFELMKKFLLNRFLLNPRYFVLLYTPDQAEMQRYVRVANGLRLLFYEKKLLASARDVKDRRIEIGQLLRNSLIKMLSIKENRSEDLNIRDRGIYINDKLLGHLFCELDDQLRSKSQNRENKRHLSLHSDSEISFSLRNDSMSRAQVPSHQSMQGHNSSIPLLPRPNPKQTHSTSRTQGNKIMSQGMSTDAILQTHDQASVTTDQLQELLTMRRQIGEERREVEFRCKEHQNRRSSWLRQVQLLGESANTKIREISKTNNEVYINLLIL